MANKKTTSKRQKDIKSKLMAAVCMLLVSSIMMVSSTYAWFTLSTAPEVTGITTQVGANGNLEMALMPKSGLTADIKSETGDSAKAAVAKNITWGNLVDLQDASYGLSQITLFPAALNMVEDANEFPDTILKTPTYGADGRVDALTANTVNGYYNGENFSPNSEYGVRAVGTASGMTDRQLDYRNARSSANTARQQAATLAKNSLSNNGSALASIAVAYGTSGTAATFDKTHVASLRAIVEDLQKAGGVMDKIEEAYLQYILAYAASAKTGEPDTVWTAIKGLINAEGATLNSVVGKLTENGMTAPSELTSAFDKFNETVADVNAADAALDTMEATLGSNPDATFTWEQIKNVMGILADPAQMTINDFEIGEIKDNISKLANSVLETGGVVVKMVSGAGVYADIADHCDDYYASIVIDEISYSGTSLENVKARMSTASTQKPSYLLALGAAAETAGAPSSGAVGTQPITDMYGYVIDMAFRTNAADSKLMLQIDAADRIYSENTNDLTQGHGSSMTFAATTADFNDQQVKDLMKAIRIVFFTPGNGTTNNTIVANAKLDVDKAETTAEGITAKMSLYTVAEGVETLTTDTALMSLNQNTAQALSVLVYLDGNHVENSDVAATASTSMTGTMNLQFASSANLVPMEYANLHTPAANQGGTSEAGSTPAPSTGN